MLKQRAASLAATAVLATVVLGCPPPEPPPEPPPVEPVEPVEPPPVDLPPGVTLGVYQRGRELFNGRANCHACHGIDGVGTALGPDLTDGVWIHLERGDMIEITTVIRTGVSMPVEFPAPMPPMGGATLTDDEIEAVSAFVFASSR